jgi:hypothetical protein
MRLPIPFAAGILSNVLPYFLGLIGVLIALSAAYFEIKRKGINQEREKWDKAQQEAASKRSIELLIEDHSPDRSAGC